MAAVWQLVGVWGYARHGEAANAPHPAYTHN